MELFDLPLTALFFILFGLVALFVLIAGIRMPGNFTKDEKIRNDLKKKIYNVESKWQDEDEKNDKNQVS